MPVKKISATEFANQLNAGIQRLNPNYDTEIGPIPDLVVQPESSVFETQNDRIRLVSQLILMSQSDVFTDSDVEQFVFNEALIRNTGGRSAGTVVFSRAGSPTVDLPVQQGFPIATASDESSGVTIVFVTTEAKTLYFASASSYFNLTTQRYELEVAVQATIAGEAGRVGTGRINRPLRPLVGFDSVTNRNPTSTTITRESNNALLERYKISILGSQLPLRNGLRLYVLGKFADAGDVLVVNAGDPLITRTGTNGNAVDVFVTGSQLISRSETHTFVGVGQPIILDSQPTTSMTSVTDGFTNYVSGVDYIYEKDVSGKSGSTRATDSIRFITGGTLPAANATLTTAYQQNLLIESIQFTLDDSDNDVGGQDVLARAATQVDIVMSATLTTLAGFSFSSIATASSNAIVAYINSLKLDNDVEQSDIQAVVRNLTGVDNLVFTLFDRSGGVGNADIPIAKNEFPRIVSTSITLTP